MRSTSRVLNRGLLLLCGLLLAVGGATAILAGRPSWSASSWLPAEQAGAAASSARRWAAGLPDVGGVPGAAVGALAAAVLLTVLLVVFVSTRRRRRTLTVLHFDADDGHTTVDRSVAEALLSGVLSTRPDVLSARTSVHRVRGTEAIGVAVTVRRGADLARVLSAAEEAVGEWDELAGVRVPVLVHLSDRGWLDGLRSSTRAH